ncbi:MAG: class I SAM-dependent methyltransferase [Bacteroidales bacterium]|nr:MAG: class I SAM-dependent methyltransferase [Bacteroidales bacterium]
MTFRIISIQVSCVVLLVCQYSYLIAQNPAVEGWEERINTRQPIQKVIETIGLKTGMVIGEVGAGTGRITVWFAAKVGSKGMVYANDIDKESLDHLEKRCKKEGFTNIKITLGTVDDPRLPLNTLDIAFMTNTYHHLDKPVELVRNLLKTLKENGILAVVERDAERTGNYHEGTKREEFIKQMDRAGFEVFLVDTTMKEDNIYLARPKKN